VLQRENKQKKDRTSIPSKKGEGERGAHCLKRDSKMTCKCRRNPHEYLKKIRGGRKKDAGGEGQSHQRDIPYRKIAEPKLDKGGWK